MIFGVYSDIPSGAVKKFDQKQEFLFVFCVVICDLVTFRRIWWILQRVEFYL